MTAQISSPGFLSWTMDYVSANKVSHISFATTLDKVRATRLCKLSVSIPDDCAADVGAFDFETSLSVTSEMGPAELYVASHKRKNGDWLSDVAKDNHVD
ncbi:hypothetical protein CJ030_MR5G024649 [Morella rubra]|uniref:Uncharacterized protein n=1 Tax=Morella rubra TaxID=262757 RepID=A0A6A1VJI5_9ROSI|nr:hypothetical protein CJ030_MR5G024649 [Morella rubra]